LTKAVLNSSVLIALSATGHLDKLGNVFEEPLVARAVYEEICVNYPPLKRWAS
jgi:predicted nucleic acid-binding protein